MNETLAIRQANAGDAHALATMFAEFNAILGADGFPAEMGFQPENVAVSTEQMQQRLAAIEGIETPYIAEAGGQPAGFICLRLVPYIGQDAPYAEVTQLFVRPQYQRHGVGAALLALAEARALEAGATCIHIITGVDNPSAQAFYRARGYALPNVEFQKHFETETLHA